jgi:hypothetical protein
MTLIEFTEALRSADWFGRISNPLPPTPFPPFQLTRDKLADAMILPTSLSEPEPFYPVGLHNRALQMGKMRHFRMVTRRVFQLALSEVTMPTVEITHEMRTAAAVAMRWAAAEVVLELEQFWLPIARVYWLGYRPIAVKNDWLFVA